jgi:hypothetical protein
MCHHTCLFPPTLGRTPVPSQGEKARPVLTRPCELRTVLGGLRRHLIP